MSGVNPWAVYQSLTRDPAQVKKVERGVLRRILTYARPYKALVAAFLVTLVVASLLTVAQPLLFRQIVDNGISQGNATLVTVLALCIAGLAILDALVGVVSRWYSARIGEGLISTCAPRSTVTCRSSRSPSSRVLKRAPLSHASTPMSSAPSKPSPRP